jgi:hypothetical protein
VLFLLLLGTSGVAVTLSTGALPGDALYPVKLAGQRVRFALTLNPVARGLLVHRYDAQRRQDVQAVLKGGRRATVEFQGTLNRMEESLWIVSGLPVVVSETTTIVGTPYLGAAVHVRGQLPGDGQLIAIWVSVDSDVGTLPTLTPEATHTPPPASTPTRPEALSPTRTVEPTPPAEGTGVPPSGDTQAQNETPGIITPEPTATPDMGEATAPTGTPELLETEDDEATPGPTEEPDPDGAPEPGGTPDEDDEPEPPETTGPDEGPEHTETPDEEEEPHEEETPGDEHEPEDGGTPPGEDEPEHGETPEPDATPDD